MCRDLIPLQPGQARASGRHGDSPRLLPGFIRSLREPWAQQLCLPLGTMGRAGEQQRVGEKLEPNPRNHLESPKSYGQAPRTPPGAWLCLCCEPRGICLCMLAAYSLPAIKSNKSSNQERGRRVHTAGPAKKGTDPDPPIAAQTIDVITGPALSTPTPARSRYVIEAGSRISCSHCSSSSLFFVSLFHSMHFLNLPSKNTLRTGCCSPLHNVIKEETQMPLLCAAFCTYYSEGMQGTRDIEKSQQVRKIM